MSLTDQLECRKLRVDRARRLIQDLDTEFHLIRSGFLLFQPSAVDEVKALSSILDQLETIQIDVLRMQRVLR
jgi:DNA-binding ferritin-like protein (Dps family)